MSIRPRRCLKGCESLPVAQRLARRPLEPNPAVLEHARQRAGSVQNRIADRITAFSGSIWFVYIHAVWFCVWIASGVEKYPYGQRQRPVDRSPRRLHKH